MIEAKNAQPFMMIRTLRITTRDIINRCQFCVKKISERRHEERNLQINGLDCDGGRLSEITVI